MTQESDTIPALDAAGTPVKSIENSKDWLIWLVIVVSVVGLQLNSWVQSKAPGYAPVVPAASLPAAKMQDAGRSALGAHLLVPGFTDAASQTAEFMESAKTPVDNLAAVAIIGELQGKKAAIDRLDALRPKLPADLAAQEKSLRGIYRGKADGLSQDQRKSLRDQFGWLGNLALTFGLPADNPDRADVLFAARKATIVNAAKGVIIYLVFVTGACLFLVLLIRLARGKFQWQYRPPTSGQGVLLQAFAIYIYAITASGVLLSFLPDAIRYNVVVALSLMFLAAAAAVAWPSLRGSGSWNKAIGWESGTGAVREIGFGLAGYIAGLPVLAVGYLITSKLSDMTGKPPTHPVEHMISGGNRWLLMLGVFLACVYAPIVEETMFRGLFFSALRARHRWIVSSLITSFVFAMVHPQAWTAVPVLLAVAMILSAIREWRGTILSSTAAHCLHNTILVGFALSA